MNQSRRSMFGLFAAVSAVAAAGAMKAAEAAPPKPKFAKGQILPRKVYVSSPITDPGHSHGSWPWSAHTHSYSGGPSFAVPITHYDIYDGTKFVDLASAEGQKVVEDLS